MYTMKFFFFQNSLYKLLSRPLKFMLTMLLRSAKLHACSVYVWNEGATLALLAFSGIYRLSENA